MYTNAYNKCSENITFFIRCANVFLLKLFRVCALRHHFPNKHALILVLTLQENCIVHLSAHRLQCKYQTLGCLVCFLITREIYCALFFASAVSPAMLTITLFNLLNLHNRRSIYAFNAKKQHLLPRTRIERFSILYATNFSPDRVNVFLGVIEMAQKKPPETKLVVTQMQIIRLNTSLYVGKKVF